MMPQFVPKRTIKTLSLLVVLPRVDRFWFEKEFWVLNVTTRILEGRSEAGMSCLVLCRKKLGLPETEEI